MCKFQMLSALLSPETGEITSCSSDYVILVGEVEKVWALESSICVKIPFHSVTLTRYLTSLSLNVLICKMGATPLVSHDSN